MYRHAAALAALLVVCVCGSTRRVLGSEPAFLHVDSWRQQALSLPLGIEGHGYSAPNWESIRHVYTNSLAQEPVQKTAKHNAEKKSSAHLELPKCVTRTVLHSGDGMTALSLKATPKCKVPMHWHTSNEQVMAVTGTAMLEYLGEPEKTSVKPGDYVYLPSQTAHSFTCSAACSFFVVSDGPFDIHYVDENGAGIPTEAAIGKEGGAVAARPYPAGITKCKAICLDPDITTPRKIGCKACESCTRKSCTCRLYSYDAHHANAPYVHEADEGVYITRDSSKNYTCSCVK